MSEPCIHENDFKDIFINIGSMTEAVKANTTATQAMKISTDLLLEYMHGKKAINSDRKERKEWTWKRTVFFSSTVISIASIIITLILKFG